MTACENIWEGFIIMRVKGVLAYISWSHVDIEHVSSKYIPKVGVIDRKSKEVVELEIEPGLKLSLTVLPQVYCLFKRSDDRYCLAPVLESHTEAIPYCKACQNIVPSLRCLMGEPQCDIREAPRNAKCIESGFYRDVCMVPRYHYLLIYPFERNTVYLKVGIERESVHPNRILEQGASVVAIYAKTPNIWIGRKIEVYSKLFLEDFVGRSYEGLRVEHVSEKKKTAMMIERIIRRLGFMNYSLTSYLDVSIEEGQHDLLDKMITLAKRLARELAMKFSKYRLPKVKIVRSMEIYDVNRDLIKSRRTVELTSFKNGMELSGIVGGWIGSYLLLNDNGLLQIVDLRRMRGHLIEITLRR
ncbi:MAG: hypothetical protein DRZ82_01375 [Thermoprotei archaeon]|nr:MAG: hypothetical protein DRZ82_01375 [Thermoprotei archaeon]